ncbi:MAG: GNAT family N-acetyltransferase [Chloroflexales bacterium]|nr:GNAT family N-acetyltransferase [Chloroflexales bacterium]
MMAAPLPGPAYRIETERLVIRCWNPIDAPLLQAAVAQSRDHLRPWMLWAPDEPEDLQPVLERLRRFRGLFDLGQDFVYGIFNTDETQVLGGTGLHTRVGDEAREIGYWIHQNYLNQGLATEASAALVKAGFEIDRVQRIEIHCAAENVRSAAVPRKLGFTHEGTLRQRLPLRDGTLQDCMIWTLLSSEYAASPAATAKIAAFDVMGQAILP